MGHASASMWHTVCLQSAHCTAGLGRCKWTSTVSSKKKNICLKIACKYLSRSCGGRSMCLGIGLVLFFGWFMRGQPHLTQTGIWMWPRADFSGPDWFHMPAHTYLGHNSMKVSTGQKAERINSNSINCGQIIINNFRSQTNIAQVDLFFLSLDYVTWWNSENLLELSNLQHFYTFFFSHINYQVNTLKLNS